MAVEPEAIRQEVTLSRDMGLLDITMIGVSGMIGAGIFVLMPIAAGVAGPALILAFLLNGVITLITAMSYAELGSAFPGAGGSYLWVREGLPGPNGFLAGWLDWFAHSVACSLYALGFGAYFAELVSSIVTDFNISLLGLSPQAFSHPWVVKALAVAAVLGFTYINWRGASETGKTAIIVSFAKLALIAVFIVSGLYLMFHRGDWHSQFTPFFPTGAGGVFTAMGLTFIAFQGYEIIVQCGDEVRNPRRNLPRAIFLSIAIVIPIYCLIVLVTLGGMEPGPGYATNWQFLGALKELGLVHAARQLMIGGPIIGGLLWIVGGLFSTISALNATIYSSSRVSFAMARNRELPAFLSQIHPVRRTPHLAILASAFIIIVIAVTLPIRDVGSAAAIMFLLLFLQVNVVAITMRRRRPDLERGFLIPLMPLVPIIGIIVQFFLAINMFHFSPIAWLVTAGWIGAGVVLYYLVVAPRGKKEKAAPVVFERAAPVSGKYHVLVPVANPEHVDNLVFAGAALAGRYQGDVTALNVIIVPDILPVEEGARFVGSAEKVLAPAVDIGRDLQVPIRTVARVGHGIPQAILNTIIEDEIDMMVLGWRGWTPESQRVLGTTLDPVIRRGGCDVAVLKAVAPIRDIKRILVGVTASPQNPLVIQTAQAFADFLKAEVTYAHIVRPGEDVNETVRQRHIEPEDPSQRLPITIWEEESPAAALIRRSEDYDLLVLGSARESVMQQLLFGSVTHIVAKQAKCSVLMVKKGPGPLKAIAREMFRPLEAGERTEIDVPEDE